ncbi:MAG: hypothetical protein EPN47_04715 [Acidobacteria bacterium]|nr:MAG: hypothetical protein EPN47_04715 [Acidobacteriota bacterium]
MRNGLGTLILTGLALALASVGPNIFPAAIAGYGTLNVLAKQWLIPSIVGVAVIALLARTRSPLIARSIGWGALAGGISTVALEAVRITGFHLGYMPGSLPKLMGVLLLDRFALGPNTASNIAGWAYHFWNGAAFGIIFVLLVGTKRVWAGLVYGLVIGVGFMVSPVVQSLGVGYFGLQFSIGFPTVVSLAHAAFGIALGWLARRFLGQQPSIVLSRIRLTLGHGVEEASLSHSQQ